MAGASKRALVAGLFGALTAAAPCVALAQDVQDVPIDAPTVAVETAPEPLPEPPAPVLTAPPPWPLYEDVTPLVLDAARRWGANPAVMRRIVWCESKNGTHAATYRADLAHRGPFQFGRATWEEQAPRYGLPGWWDAALIPECNVDLAAALIARGQTWRWPNC